MQTGSIVADEELRMMFSLRPRELNRYNFSGERCCCHKISLVGRDPATSFGYALKAVY